MSIQCLLVKMMFLTIFILEEGIVESRSMSKIDSRIFHEPRVYENGLEGDGFEERNPVENNIFGMNKGTKMENEWIDGLTLDKLEKLYTSLTVGDKILGHDEEGNDVECIFMGLENIYVCDKIKLGETNPLFPNFL
ncbi:uncharacterized protein [Lepeophtheirus salmonis]|uniref:Uncharacterized protein n=1 Tax=Lepeophtheirus salmonis TaxID=72036 RepID=A0A0K2TZH4_LEPSM|nr:uncharacterized protein LOC121119345 [Lepeophtheirus salmonis]XP_040569932.1 uncharacterized protein LOC121119345 [Lepeophtheirus salmonis]